MADPADLLAIRALVDGYALAADRRDRTAFVALFAPDATLTTYDVDDQVAGGYAGAAELATVIDRLERYERTLHLVATHLAEVDGDEATGSATCEAHHRRADGRDRVLLIRYDDRYARRGPGWVIQGREVHVRFSEERPAPARAGGG